MANRGLIGLIAAFLYACGGVSGSDVDSERIDSSGAALLHAPAIKRVNLHNGVTLEYLEQGDPHGRAVIFIHGYTDSHHSFDENLPIFPARYHVYALDQRGHGNSSKPACCYTQADFSRDVIRFMDVLGIPSATLVGHSMGSFIAHRTALNFPSRIDRLVLIGSAPTVAGNPVALDFKTAVDTLVDPIDPEFVREFQASTFFRPIPPSFLDTSVSESLKVPATVWQQALAGLLADDHSARLGQIRAPTLILYGDQDIFFTAAEEAELAARIPHSTLIVYPQTGHGTHVERPREVVRDMGRFLR